MANNEMIFAGFWRRLAACFFDLLVINVFAVFSMLVLFFLISRIIRMQLEIISVLVVWIWLFYYFLYFTVMESSPRQATLGKIIMGLKVMDMHGNKITFLKALGRNAGKILSTASLFIGFLTAAFSRKKQALHDIISGCVVVKYRKSNLVIAILISISSFLLVVSMDAIFIYFVYHDVFASLTKPAKLLGKPFLLPEEVSHEEVAINLSETEYDSLLISKRIAFESGITTSVGPSAFQFSNYMEGAKYPRLALKVRLIQIPNIKLADKKFVRLLITHVWDRSHQDVYGRDNPLEKEYFQRLSFSKPHEPSSYLEANRNVYLRPGVKEKDIESIEGKLILELPLRMEMVTFYGLSVGKEVSIGRIKVTLKAMEGSEVLLHYTSPFKDFINAFAYNEAVKQLRNIGSSQQTADDSADIKLLYSGPVKSVKVIVAQGFMERNYPFVLRLH